MRGVDIPISQEEELQSPPWGDRSAVRGEKNVADSLTFREQYEIGTRFKPAELLNAAKELFPPWFQEEPNLTPAAVASRLNAGGRHPDMGDKAFRLQFNNGYWRIRTFMQVLKRFDLTEEVARVTENKKALLDSFLQDAEDEIKKLPVPVQQQMLVAYQKYDLALVEAMRQLQRDVTLAVTDLASGHALSNGGSQKALKR
jgi:hypothetical protein